MTRRQHSSSRGDLDPALAAAIERQKGREAEVQYWPRAVRQATDYCLRIAGLGNDIVARSEWSSREDENRRMTDAVHDQHWRLATPRDHDRIVTTGPAVSSPPVAISFAEVMLSRNRCRATVLSRFGEMLTELSFNRDQVVCLGRDQAPGADLHQ
jgi:hypothetical protein